MDKIDVVFYINLAHRTDRRASIEEQCKKVGLLSEKVVRIDAIKRTPGTLGCIMSHIKTMETFLANPEQKVALVLEDDFIFNAESSATDEIGRAERSKLCSPLSAELDHSLNVLFANFP